MSKISYSAYKKYMTCPKMYDYHYNDKLRPTGTSSALIFGLAIDEALNGLLLKTGDPIQLFQKNFEFENLQNVEWDARDFDIDLFTQDQKDKIFGQTWEYKCWASMRIKGRMLIEAYIEQVYPKIKEVYHVQKELDGRPGVLDAIVNFDNYGKILIDHKTASRPYMNDAVKYDTQLALYADSEGLNIAGFIVLVKEINKNKVKICAKCAYNGSGRQHKTCPQLKKGKRCNGSWDETVSPEAQIQILIDKVPSINKELITEAMSQVENAVKSSIYPRNLQSCSKMYGKPCAYAKKCWQNDESGLEYKKEDK